MTVSRRGKRGDAGKAKRDFQTLFKVREGLLKKTFGKRGDIKNGESTTSNKKG